MSGIECEVMSVYLGKNIELIYRRSRSLYTAGHFCDRNKEQSGYLATDFKVTVIVNSKGHINKGLPRRSCCIALHGLYSTKEQQSAGTHLQQVQDGFPIQEGRHVRRNVRYVICFSSVIMAFSHCGTGTSRELTTWSPRNRKSTRRENGC